MLDDHHDQLLATTTYSWGDRLKNDLDAFIEAKKDYYAAVEEERQKRLWVERIKEWESRGPTYTFAARGLHYNSPGDHGLSILKGAIV